MNLTLVVTKNCKSCTRAEDQMKKLTAQNENLKLLIVNLNDVKYRGIDIVPALIIEDELFAYGDINEEKLLLKLKPNSPAV